MSAPAKLGAFALALVVVLGASVAVGRLVDPSTAGSGTAGHGHGTDAGHGAEGGHDGGGHDGGGHEAAGAGEAAVGGLAVSAGGTTLVPEAAVLGPGQPHAYRFRVVDEAGAPVTAFDEVHERRLHLLVIGRDLATYHHLHPAMAPDGTWEVELPALAPGPYRVLADLTPTGAEARVLGVDLAVPGPWQPAALPPATGRDEVDGYEVTLSGHPTAGRSGQVALTVTRGGQPVTDLQPYLGALGHLVAVRDGDLAALHVHPLEEAAGTGGPEVPFAVEVPSAGAYRLFFDFAHGDVVRTAAFTVDVPPGGGAS